MRTKALLLASVFLILTGLTSLAAGVQAAPIEPQAAYPSPTPGPDGRIIYVVKGGDTCAMVEILYGVTDQYLRQQNALNSTCDLREGQKLVIGMGGPASASPTPGPSPIPTLPQPTATPVNGGTAVVCVLVYNDLNGDGLRQSTEPAIAGAALSLGSPNGAFSQTLTTVINSDSTAYQGVCFTSVPMGKYNVSAAAPDGYNPTINLSSSITVVAGDTVYIDFGAQVKTVVAAPAAAVKKTSPLLGILGTVFLLGGLGLGIYVWRMMRRK